MPSTFARHTAAQKRQSPSPTKPSRANPAQTLDSGRDLSPASAFVHDFSRTPVRTRTPFVIQPKLTINPAGDESEQEADRISESVMRMPEPPLQAASTNKYPTQQNEPHADQLVRTKRVEPSTGAQIAAPPIVHEVLSSTGQPLDAGTRAFMEPRFGHDFSGVRVHTDARSADAASAISARVFTASRDIVFGSHEYAPHTESGRRLLSHELTHVVQQTTCGTGARQQAAGGLIQRQKDSITSPKIETEEPSPRALMLLQMFSNRPMSGKLSFKRFTPSEFDREYKATGARHETIHTTKLGIPWTYTFVTNEATYSSDKTFQVTSIFVRESQDGTQIVNFYQRSSIFGTGGDPVWINITNQSIFKKGTQQFDFSSAEFLQFYTRLDRALLDTPDISHTPLSITVDGPKDALNIERANTIKKDLIKRGAKGLNIAIEFGGKPESPGIQIKNNFQQ